MAIPQSSAAKNAREWAEEIKANPCTSYWLREALTKLFQRDPLDAERDAELLHRSPELAEKARPQNRRAREAWADTAWTIILQDTYHVSVVAEQVDFTPRVPNHLLPVNKPSERASVELRTRSRVAQHRRGCGVANG